MATTSVKRRPQGAQRKPGTRRASNGARAESPEPTKAATKPPEQPQKAHKPGAATKSGAPSKAHKPKAAREATKASPPKPKGGEAKKNGSGAGLEKAAEAAHTVAGPGKALVKAATPGGSATMRKLAVKVGQSLVDRALSRGADSLQQTREKLFQSAATSTEPSSRRRPPIQCCVDAGVPVTVAWDEWMALAWLPEGVDRVLDVKRRAKGKLTGRLADSPDAKWSAKILDEREDDSFAWQSHGGSDCAGLITFHPLGDTLTRIEVSLDVVPMSLSQAAALTTRLADRRTQADLKRFKARLELINPDLYEDDATQAG